MSVDPCKGNPRPQNAGEIELGRNKGEMNLPPGLPFYVGTVGDGTCEFDYMLHGFFLKEFMAQLFKEALENYKASLGVSNDEWLRHVHGASFETKAKKQPHKVA